MPRELIVQDTSDAPKKKGRPSKADRLRKTQAAVEELDRWLQNTGAPAGSETTTHKLLLQDPTSVLEHYSELKTHLLDELEDDSDGVAAITEANKQVYYRLKKAAELNETEETGTDNVNDAGPGMPRVERAIIQGDSPSGGPRGGLLGLLEGAGNPNLM